MKNNLFTFKNKKLLCWRLGNVNAVKQLHYNRDVVSVAGMGTHKPPVSRGVWAFPYPHYDFFFCYHQWEKRLPKKYSRKDSDGNPVDQDEEFWNERERLLKEIQKKFRPTTFYSGEFYSHIFPNGRTDYNDWYFWDNSREWANVAKKLLIVYEKWNGGLFKMTYGKDHLEIFVPNP